MKKRPKRPKRLKCSICMATYQKPEHLRETLKSIHTQNVPFRFEVIVVDDGSKNNKENRKICKSFPITQYIYLDRPYFCNCARAKNTAYKAAQSDIIISQSDDVIHVSINMIEKLVTLLDEDTIVRPIQYKSKQTTVKWLRDEKHYKSCKKVVNKRNKGIHSFHLGSVWRKDVFVIGGHEEAFKEPGNEDLYFSECLTQGLGLQIKDCLKLICCHSAHPFQKPSSFRGNDPENKIALKYRLDNQIWEVTESILYEL